MSPDIRLAPFTREDAPPGSEVHGYVAKLDGKAKASFLDDNYATTQMLFPIVGDSTEKSSTQADDRFFPVDEQSVI